MIQRHNAHAASADSEADTNAQEAAVGLLQPQAAGTPTPASTIQAQVTAVVTQNEVGGQVDASGVIQGGKYSGTSIYSIFNPANSSSGYEIGAAQNDLLTKPTARTDFINLLNATASTTGLTSDQISSIQSSLTSSGQNATIAQYTSQINQALSSAQGQAVVNNLDTTQFAADSQTVANFLGSAQNAGMTGVLAQGTLDPTSIGEIAQATNMFAPATLAPLNQFLAGQTVTAQDGTSISLATPGTVTLSDLNNFFGNTNFFSNNPRNFNTFQQNAQTIGQNYTYPAPGPTPPAPTPPAPSPSGPSPSPASPSPAQPSPTPPAPTPPAPTPPAPTPPAPTPAPAPSGPIGSGSGGSGGGSFVSDASRKHPRVGGSKAASRSGTGAKMAASASVAHATQHQNAAQTASVSLVKSQTTPLNAARKPSLAHMIAEAEHRLRTGDMNAKLSLAHAQPHQAPVGSHTQVVGVPAAKAHAATQAPVMSRAEHAAMLLKQAMVSYAPAGALDAAASHTTQHTTGSIAKPPVAGGAVHRG